MTAAVTYPVVEFSLGQLVVVHDDRELRRWSRAGLRAGWHHNLVLVDAALQRRSVTLRHARPEGLAGWLQGRLVADLRLGEPTVVSFADVQQQVLDVFERHVDFWDADGLLADRRRAVQLAIDMPHLIRALETTAF